MIVLIGVVWYGLCWVDGRVGRGGLFLDGVIKVGFDVGFGD